MTRRRSAFTLKTDGGYTPRERQIFGLLMATRPQDRDQIVRLIWKNGSRPRNAAKMVVDSIRSLRQQLDVNREPCRIVSTSRAGGVPLKFWLEAR